MAKGYRGVSTSWFFKKILPEAIQRDGYNVSIGSPASDNAAIMARIIWSQVYHNTIWQLGKTGNFKKHFMNYKGYEIKGSFIYKDGKEVFIGTWRQDRDEAAAMRLIDGQVDFIPPVVATTVPVQHEDCCELENGSEQRERFEERMNDYFDNQMYE